MPKGNTTVADPDVVAEAAEVAANAAAANATQDKDLDTQIRELTTEITTTNIRADALGIAIGTLPEATPAEVKASLVGERDKLLAIVERRQKQLERLTEQQRYGQWTQPFLTDIAKIAFTEYSKDAEHVPTSVSIDAEEIAKARRNHYAALDALDAVEEARDRHLKEVPAEVWDALSNKKVHFKFEEIDGTKFIVGSFASGRRAGSGGGTGRGRGTPITYTVIALPDDYSGPASVGDQFGPGTDNPVGKDYAEMAGGAAWVALIAERTSDGKGGRVSAASGLRQIGFTLEERRAAEGTPPDPDDEDDDDEEGDDEDSDE